jgi:hypothetical protein
MEVVERLPSFHGCNIAYNDRVVASRGGGGKGFSVEVETDSGYVRQTYFVDTKSGRRRPHAICRHTGIASHPDCALGGGGERSHYMYALRSDGRVERAWYMSGACLAAAKGNTSAIESTAAIKGTIVE